MAVTRHKLTIGGGQTAGQAVTYLADPQAAGDYYSEARRALMIWSASARARAELGLGSRVELSKVERLLSGRHPISGELLRQYGPTGTMVGALDLTVSPAPKSVSILWALAGPELRRQFEDMVIAAVAGAVGVVSRHAAIVRDRYGPGANDVRAIKGNDVIGLRVLHTTARIAESKAGIPDPQLHIHALMFGDLREDGRLRAIESKFVLQHLGAIDGSAQAELAVRLQRAGFEIERTPVLAPNGTVKRIAWEIKGIPPSLIKAMSGRSQEISDLARQYRETTGREAIGPGWERFVGGRRGAKGNASAEELAELWRAEAEEHGLNAEEVALLILQAQERAPRWSEREETSFEARQLRHEILENICREHALVPERKLDALTQKRAVGLVSPYTAEGVVIRLFADGDLLRTTEGQVTTLEVLAQEQRAERALRRLLDVQPAPAVAPERLHAMFEQAEEEGRPFDPEQRAAIALAASGAHFVSISGPAGTGKGWASHAMTEIWHEQGRRVIALAVAGRTAQQAKADSGADLGMTLNGLEARLKPRWSPPVVEWPPPFRVKASDVLLVDEAGMIDHERYPVPLEAAADAGATLVQIGDDQQLNPVGPGGLWRLFHAAALERRLAVELREVHRTKDPAEAQAWTDLRDGRIEEALSWYRDVGHLRLYDTRQELRQGMVAAWWELNREGVMLVDTSNAERDALNRLAQAKRIEAGELGAESFRLATGAEVRVGDRVLTAKEPIYLDRQLNPRGGQRIENGIMATVTGLRLAPTRPAQESSEAAANVGTAAQKDQHEAASAGSVELQLHEPEGDRSVQVDASAQLELGYTRHIQKGQGMTAAKEAPSMDAALSGHTSQQQLYTLLTRSREGTRVHLLRAEVEELGIDAKELEAARVEVNTQPELDEMALPAPQLKSGGLRMFNEAELHPGQVVTFGEALPLRQPSGVEAGELGLVRSVHQGGVSWDFARVELVGGREVNVYQPDLVELAAPDIGPEAVTGQPATVAQRDPYGLGHLPLENGQILARDDLVRFPETEAQGRVTEVNRHTENCAWVEIEGSQERVPVYATSQVEVTKTGAEVVAEAAAQEARQVEDASIREAARTAEREGPKRAVGETAIESRQETVAERTVQRESNQETRQLEATSDLGEASQEHQERAQEAETEPQANPEQVREQVPERLREAAQEAQQEPQAEPQTASEPEGSDRNMSERSSHAPEAEAEPVSEPEQQAAQAREQAQQEAVAQSAGQPGAEASAQPAAQPQGAQPQGPSR